MQGWLFKDNYWNESLVRSLVTAVPPVSVGVMHEVGVHLKGCGI